MSLCLENNYICTDKNFQIPMVNTFFSELSTLKIFKTRYSSNIQFYQHLKLLCLKKILHTNFRYFLNTTRPNLYGTLFKLYLHKYCCFSLLFRKVLSIFTLYPPKYRLNAIYTRNHSRSWSLKHFYCYKRWWQSKTQKIKHTLSL